MRPEHYKKGGVEPIDVIEAFKLGFHTGNVLKYLGRAQHKGDEEGDLKKALWYLDRSRLNLPEATGGFSDAVPKLAANLLISLWTLSELLNDTVFYCLVVDEYGYSSGLYQEARSSLETYLNERFSGNTSA